MVSEFPSSFSPSFLVADTPAPDSPTHQGVLAGILGLEKNLRPYNLTASLQISKEWIPRHTYKSLCTASDGVLEYR